MGSTDVAVPPQQQERRRLAAKRRAEAQPYEPRRPRRSQRLGGADEDQDDQDDDDVLAVSPRRAPATSTGGGLFSRLFSFFPAVGKFVADEQKNDAMANEEAEIVPHGSVRAAPAVTVADENIENDVKQNGHAPAAHQPQSARSPPSKRNSPANRTTKNAVQPEPKASVAVDSQVPSSGSATSVFTQGTQKTTKNLKINNAIADKEPFAHGRMTGRRRSKPSSPSVTESPQAVIKKKKVISFEEYERLSNQLRSLVDPTPENALALTRSALTNALEGRGPSVGGHSGENNGLLSVAALPSTKRARPSDEMAITLPREDRVVRKPRPSRLLTGTKRDAAARSAYSAAVAEKILSTLNKLQTPLVQETQKPTPSTSLSWAKYHLALNAQDTAKPRMGMDDMDTEDEEMPPTSSIPKIAWKPTPPVVEQQQPTKTSAFSFPKSSDATSFNGSRVPSAPTVSVAPTSLESRECQIQTEQRIGRFAFTLPAPSHAQPMKHTDEDSMPQYFFTPPPALCEPPKRAHGQKALIAKSGTSTAPFSFMPSSPKVRPESLTKSVPPKAKSPPASTIVSAKVADAAASSPNPLARFMKLDAGSWKCPTCAVTNGIEHAKCPCCETDKPVISSQHLSAAPTTTSGGNPLAKFMKLDEGSWKCPTCAVTNGIKYTKCPCCETDKPGVVANAVSKKSEATPPSGGSISAGGFTFGVPSAAAKKVEVPQPLSTGGFKFGVATTPEEATTSSADKSGTATISAPGTTGFTFGATQAGEKASTSTSSVNAFKFNSSPAPTGFTFGPTITVDAASKPQPTHKRKASDEVETEGKEKKLATESSAPSSSVGSFTFGSSSGVQATPPSWGGSSDDKVTVPPSAPKSSGFSFGSTATIAQLATVSARKKPIEFSFSSGEPAAPPQKSSLPSFLSAGAGTKTVTTEKKEKSLAMTTTSSFGSTTVPSKTGFTFGSSTTGDMSKPALGFRAPTPEGKSTDATPSKAPVVLGTETKKDTSPAFSFGSSSSGAFGSKDSGSDDESKSSKPFTFGSTTADAVPVKATASFGQPTFAPSGGESSKKPAFSFGAGPSASSTATATSLSTPSFSSAPATPAFAFGSAKPTEAAAPAFSFGGSSQAGAGAFGSAASDQGADQSGGSFSRSSSFASNASTSTGFGGASSGFGSASTGFGSSTTASGFGSTTASTGFGSTASTMSTSFGSAAPTMSTGMSMGISTGFGSTPSTTPSFTAAPSFAFGASAPATSQPAFGFGGASTSSSAFNTPSTDVFGSSQVSGFGAPSAGGTFGSSAPSSGFGASPAPAFGSTPLASPPFGSTSTGGGFGAGPSTSFGAGGSGFGGPSLAGSFGAAPGGFGTPNAFGAPPTGFGATPSPATSSGYGATPSASGFGASPASGFGSTSSFGSAPAAGAFGGPPPAEAGGFSMGAAPAAPKRRILKAKSSRTTKRT